MSSKTKKRVAIIGSGPAALMAADSVSEEAGIEVTVFEKRKGLGRKLLIAGSSGLNITHSVALNEFIQHYTGPRGFWESLLKGFTPQDWLKHVEALGIPTFEGTSGRFFVEGMKASKLLAEWRKRLESRGVSFQLGKEAVEFSRDSDRAWALMGLEGGLGSFDALCFCLGGGSYESDEVPLRWLAMFERKGLRINPFAPSNAGYEVAWKQKFLDEAEGRPIKGVVLRSTKGSRKGEIMITKYGMEGTPVYFVGEVGRLELDLKPDLTEEQILARLEVVKENLSPIRRVKKKLSLDPTALALLFHMSPLDVQSNADLRRFCRLVKAFPIQTTGPRPLAEAISSSGGLDLKELNVDLMIEKLPGVFTAGEMLDWDVPTGGFLIQGCVAQGRRAGQGILRYLTEFQQTR